MQHINNHLLVDHRRMVPLQPKEHINNKQDTAVMVPPREPQLHMEDMLHILKQM